MHIMNTTALPSMLRTHDILPPCRLGLLTRRPCGSHQAKVRVKPGKTRVAQATDLYRPATRRTKWKHAYV